MGRTLDGVRPIFFGVVQLDLVGQLDHGDDDADDHRGGESGQTERASNGGEQHVSSC